jgi:hypothetical protein
VALAALLAAGCLAACAGPGTYNDALGRPAPPGTDVLAISGFPVTSLLAPPAAGGPGGTSGTTAFCQDVQQLRGLASIFSAPAQGTTGITRAKALIDHLPSDAPAQIRPAAATLADATDRLTAAVGTSQPDFAQLTTVLARFEVSLQQVLGYAGTHC